MNTIAMEPTGQTPPWVSYAALVGLIAAVPAAFMAIYVSWAGSVVREGAMLMMRQGVVPDSMDKVPGWTFVYTVGTWAPLIILALITWPVLKQSRRVVPWFGLLARAALGVMWGWSLF